MPLPSGRGRLLTRVRERFRLLLGLLLVVEGIEWLDATTPVWPDRIIAAGALVAAAWWSVELHRRAASPWWLDGWLAVAVLATGWGLGRSGGALALLLGAALQRSLYGRRRSVTCATVLYVVGYHAADVLRFGPDVLREVGILTVPIGLLSVAAVIRLVAEVMARHDIAAAWDLRLTEGAAELLAASRDADVDVTVAAVLTDLRELGPPSGGGLLDVPAVPEMTVNDEVPAIDSGEGTTRWALTVRLDRLLTDARSTVARLGSESRYRQLAELTRDGIYLRALDRPRELSYANAAVLAILPPEVARAGPPFPVDVALVHPGDRDQVRHALNEDAYVAEPLRLRLADGPEDGGEGSRWVEVVEVVSTVADGRIEIVQGTVRDVSRQLQHEAALQAALDDEVAVAEQLRLVDELRTTFLAAVSHELRTPLAALLGSSQTLAHHRSRLSPAQSSELAGVIRRQGERLERLLDDLLDVERLSRGHIKANRRSTRLLALVSAIAVEHGSKNGRISIDPASDDVVIDVDASQVERIVDNLLRNALTHTPSGTRIAVGVHQDDGGVRLVVEDDGPGVPVSFRTELFEPFAQGQEAATSASPGTGIGLSLVSKFAELHGGRAWVEEPEDGHGARFVVFLAAPTDDGDHGLSLHHEPVDQPSGSSHAGRSEHR